MHHLRLLSRQKQKPSRLYNHSCSTEFDHSRRIDSIRSRLFSYGTSTQRNRLGSIQESTPVIPNILESGLESTPKLASELTHWSVFPTSRIPRKHSVREPEGRIKNLCFIFIDICFIYLFLYTQQLLRFRSVMIRAHDKIRCTTEHFTRVDHFFYCSCLFLHH